MWEVSLEGASGLPRGVTDWRVGGQWGDSCRFLSPYCLKCLQGPLPLPQSPSLPGSSPSPAPWPHQRQGQGQRGTRGEMGPHLGQGWLISLNPPTQGEAASIIAKLRAWRLLTLAPPGSVGWDVGNSRSGSPHPGPRSSFSRAVSVTHHNRGLGHSG